MNRSVILTLTLSAALAAPASAIEKGVSLPLGSIVTPTIQAAGEVPALSLGVPALPKLPVAPELSVPQVSIPLAVVPAPQAAMPRMKATMAAIAEMPKMSAASDGQAKGAGDNVAAALTGEKLAGGSDAVQAQAPAYATQAEIDQSRAVVHRVLKEVAKVMVGQDEMMKITVMSLIMKQHALLEGVPGVGKTEAIKAVADAVTGKFSRVQGTYDKLPSDIIGVEVIETDLKTGEKKWVVKKGPVFGDIVLVDEINRMTGKAQSSVLEVMAEKRTTIGNTVFSDDFKHFTLLATQNPVEQDGTNRLPEAQQDRFWAKVIVPQPTREEMMEITRRNDKRIKPKASKVASLEDLDEVEKVAEKVRFDDSLRDYAIQIAMAPSHMPQVKENVDYTVYVRAGIYLSQAARLHALIEGRNYVTPADIRALAPLVLRGRIALNNSADLGGKNNQENIELLIKKVIATVPVPKGYEEQAQAGK